jgi:hypothetical protein
VARAHVYRPITDEQGNLLPNCSVTVQDANGDPLGQPLYASPDGSESLTNPFVTSSGIVNLWVEEPQRLLVSVEPQSRPAFAVYVDAQPSGDEVFHSPQGRIKIVNQGTPGDILQLTTVPDKDAGVVGEATWDAVPGTVVGLTAKTTIIDWPLNDDIVPAGITFTGIGGVINGAVATPVAGEAVVAATVVGTTLSKALLMPIATDTGLLDTVVWEYSALATFDVTMTEAGIFSCYAKAVRDATLNPGDVTGGFTEILAQVLTPAGWSVEVVGPTRYVSDTDFIPYSLLIPAGTSKIRLIARHSFNGDDAVDTFTKSSVYIAGIKVVRGGQMPSHTHGDPTAQTLVLGPGASVGTSVNATAIGAGTLVGADNGTAIGAAAEAANISSTAIGYSTLAAGDRAAAVGALCSATGNDAVAVGHGSSASGAAAVAVGESSIASADYSVAVGTGTSATGAGAIALGSDATAAAPDSAAIGPRATVAVGHSNSMAFGADAATTAADQIVLGTGTTMVYVPGEFRVLGDTVIGSGGSKVGFFGGAGVTKPAVTGSRSGNAALASLLTALSDLGLITDSTTA